MDYLCGVKHSRIRLIEKRLKGEIEPKGCCGIESNLMDTNDSVKAKGR